MSVISLLINLIIIIINPAPRLNYAAKEWENFKDSENIFVNCDLCTQWSTLSLLINLIIIIIWSNRIVTPIILTY